MAKSTISYEQKADQLYCTIHMPTKAYDIYLNKTKYPKQFSFVGDYVFSFQNDDKARKYYSAVAGKDWITISDDMSKKKESALDVSKLTALYGFLNSISVTVDSIKINNISELDEYFKVIDGFFKKKGINAKSLVDVISKTKVGTPIDGIETLDLSAAGKLNITPDMTYNSIKDTYKNDGSAEDGLEYIENVIVALRAIDNAGKDMNPFFMKLGITSDVFNKIVYLGNASYDTNNIVNAVSSILLPFSDKNRVNDSGFGISQLISNLNAYVAYKAKAESLNKKDYNMVLKFLKYAISVMNVAKENIEEVEIESKFNIEQETGGINIEESIEKSATYKGILTNVVNPFFEKYKEISEKTKFNAGFVQKLPLDLDIANSANAESLLKGLARFYNFCVVASGNYYGNIDIENIVMYRSIAAGIYKDPTFKDLKNKIQKIGNSLRRLQGPEFAEYRALKNCDFNKTVKRAMRIYSNFSLMKKVAGGWQNSKLLNPDFEEYLKKFNSYHSFFDQIAELLTIGLGEESSFKDLNVKLDKLDELVSKINFENKDKIVDLTKKIASQLANLDFTPIINFYKNIESKNLEAIRNTKEIEVTDENRKSNNGMYKIALKENGIDIEANPTKEYYYTATPSIVSSFNILKEAYETVFGVKNITGAFVESKNNNPKDKINGIDNIINENLESYYKALLSIATQYAILLSPINEKLGEVEYMVNKLIDFKADYPIPTTAGADLSEIAAAFDEEYSSEEEPIYNIFKGKKNTLIGSTSSDSKSKIESVFKQPSLYNNLTSFTASAEELKPIVSKKVIPDDIISGMISGSKIQLGDKAGQMQQQDYLLYWIIKNSRSESNFVMTIDLVESK